MRIIRKRIPFVVITIITSVVLLYHISAILERKTSIRKYNDYFNAYYNYDVLFFGTSHVINGIYPMEMWRDYGIVGYNFGNDASPMAQTYWTLINALDYSKPEVVFVDCYGISNQTKVSTKSFEFVHAAFDAFPFSVNKLKAARDLTNDSVRDEMIQNGEISEENVGSPLQLLWNFSVYHSRWNDLKWYDFNVNYTPEAGAESRVAVAIPGEMADKTSEIFSLDTVGFSYLDKIAEECYSRNIDLVLTYLPFPAEDNGVWKEINALNLYSEKTNIPFINFFDDNLCELVDYQVDMYDSMSHLNPSGAKKVSDYLANYILVNYPELDKRDDLDVAEALNEAFDSYKGYKASLLRDQTDLHTYLMLLNDKDFSCEISYCSEDVLNRDGGVFARNIALLGKPVFNRVEKLDASSDGQSPDMWISVYYSNNGKRPDRVSVKGDTITHE